MDGLDAAFAGAFGQPQNDLPPQQEPQQQPQCQCCANQHCQFQGMPVGTLHYCQFCGGIMHGPCGPEIEVQGGMVTIKDSSNINPVPYEQLRSPDPDKPAPHQICGLCIESIKTRQMNERNNYAAAPSTSNPIAASATHPSVIALFPDIPPDTPRDVVDEMLEDAMEGRSGPALQQQWQQFFGTNRSKDPSTRLRDVYIAQERASDTFCGRLVGGLDEHSPEFAVSYTEFLALDDEQTVNGGMSQVDQRNQQAEP